MPKQINKNFLKFCLLNVIDLHLRLILIQKERMLLLRSRIRSYFSHFNSETICVVFILEKRNDKTGEIIFDSEKYSTTNPSGFTTEEYIRCLTIFENKRRASFEFTKVSTNCMYIYYDGVVFIHKNGLVVYWDRDPLKTRTNDED